MAVREARTVDHPSRSASASTRPLALLSSRRHLGTSAAFRVPVCRFQRAAPAHICNWFAHVTLSTHGEAADRPGRRRRPALDGVSPGRLSRGISVSAYLGRLVEAELKRREGRAVATITPEMPAPDQAIAALAEVRDSIDELNDLAGRLARSAIAHGAD